MTARTGQEIVKSLLKSAHDMQEMGMHSLYWKYQNQAETAAFDHGIFDEMFPELAADRDHINRLELAH